MINQVSSTTLTTPTTSTTNLDNNIKSISKEDFLKLLVTELEHQDPLEPMKNQEYVAQLTQLSSLEELRDVNKNLLSSQDMYKSINDNLATSFIGKEGKFTSETIEVKNGAASNIYYDLPQQAGVTVDIYDKDDNMVRKLIPGVQKAGENQVYWDGKNQKGEKVLDGSYKYKITAVGKNNQTLQVDSVISSRITGVKFKDGQALLKIGAQEIPLTNVLELNEVKEATQETKK